MARGPAFCLGGKRRSRAGGFTFLCCLGPFLLLRRWLGAPAFLPPAPLSPLQDADTDGEAKTPVPNQPALDRRSFVTATALTLTACTAHSSCEAAPLWTALPSPPSTSQNRGYPVRFVAYLTRFLLNVDPLFRKLWDKEKDEEASNMFLGLLESKSFRRDSRFARFSRTVELCVSRSFHPKDGGAARLFKKLEAEFGSSFEAQRQLCILFSLLQDETQPVETLRALLRTVENATITKVELLGDPAVVKWASGYEAANISTPPITVKVAGPSRADGTPARLSYRLQELQRIANESERSWTLDAIVVQDGGSGYSTDVDLEVQLVPGPGAVIEKQSDFKVSFERSRTPTENLTQPSDMLARKLTALLPSDLLPTYKKRLGRFVPDQSVPLPQDPGPDEESQILDVIFGPEKVFDRFRADFVFAEFDATYGPVGLSPLERERRLLPSDYLRLALSGAMANFARELVFIPVKNVKVRLQTDPKLGAQGGLFAVLPLLIQREPIANLYRAVDVACIAGIGTGLAGFGITEYLKRELLEAFPALGEVVALIVASAVSVLAIAFVLAPLEGVATRVMSGQGLPASKNPRPYWGTEVLLALAKQSGVPKAAAELYEEYGLLVVRELGFSVTKFVVFDSLREGVLFMLPSFASSQSLLVACLCGAVAGIAATLVSHPIDTIFALRASGQGGGELPSLDRLYRGVGPRILIYSPGIALTFLVYDLAKTALGVGASALLQTVDVFGGA